MRYLLLALLVTSCAAQAATVELPSAYPPEPDEAVGIFLYAREVLHATCITLTSQELRAADYVGKAIEVQANLAGRVWSVSTAPDGRQVIIRLQLHNGQSLSTYATSELKGLVDGDSVRAILEVPTGEEPRFHLRAVVLEYDLPNSKPATSPSAGPVKAPAAGGNLAVPPEYREAPLQYRLSGTVPAMGKFAVPVTGTPRPGKEGTWDPVGNIGYPIIAQNTLDIWVDWIRHINPKLTERQADWIARWVIYYSAVNGVDHRLIFAMIKCESDFDPWCTSSAGAMGLTQLMPCNVEDFHVINVWNVQENIRAGVEHFREMLDMWAGRSNYEQFALAAASYNAGPNRVKRAGGIPDITETRNYVKKLGDLFYRLCKDGYP